MFRFKLILILFFLGATVSWAQEKTKTTPHPTGIYNPQTLALSYMSWTEMATIESSTASDSAYANFYGMGLSWEKESYKFHHGSIFDIGAFFGQANIGGSQPSIVYQANYRPWYGAEASYRYAYRLTTSIGFSIGPFVLTRKVEWPANDQNVNASSGSQTNGGLMGELRYRVTPRYEIRQMIGTLATKASTIWALSLGYKF